VKGYAAHEDKLFRDIAELRAKSISGGTVTEQSQVSQAMSGMLGRLFAIAEAYPELKADANFRDLQDKLAGVEDEIQLSRRYYNGAVRNFNTMIESFPTNIISGFFQFAKADFFEIGDQAARQVPKVEFNKAS
jgi:LemA protein